tara:strand:- start:28423 stop:29334 length:912 start_codon:yes stop_codon:yes gene_type:complete
MHQKLKSAPITCVITTYNNRSTIRRAVDSVLSQTLPVSEIIIADDGSTDGSAEVIQRISSAHSIVLPLIRPKNLGVSANRDLAIRSASQPFITHLDGDDLFCSKKVYGEWLALSGRKNAVAYSFIGVVQPGSLMKSTILDPSATVTGDTSSIVRNLLFRNGPIPRDMMLSKALYELVGGFRHNIPLYEDWQFKILLASKGAVWSCSQQLGTLYMQMPFSLSRADSSVHIEWKKHVISSLGSVLTDNLSPEDIDALCSLNSSGSKLIKSQGFGLVQLCKQLGRKPGDIVKLFRYLPEIRRAMQL